MITQPIFFERNRVGRVYSGGKLFSSFFGDKAEDGFLPEEWIASCVKAINRVQLHEKEGVSRIAGTDMYFDSLLEKYPKELCGSSGKMRILVKVLDSAVRLPAQAHPDKAFSRKYFNSGYGKTESWIILDTRENAKIYFGFKDGVDRAVFEKAIDESKTDKAAMERLMLYREPKKDDCFLVPARTVHAIGAGCLILEIQEPTDFTVQPEHWCDEYELNDREMYLSLTKEQAIDCFDFEKAPDTKMVPQIIFEDGSTVKEALIGKAVTDCFCVNRIKLSDSSFLMNTDDSYGVYIVTEGSGFIKGENYKKEIKKGDYFFMPSIAMGKFTLSGNCEVIECY